MSRQGLLEAVLRRSPAQPLFRWRAARRLVVLAYHGIADAGRFAAQLDYLRGHLHPVGLEEVLRALSGGERLPKRAVLITFDDGDRSVFERGLPLLRERGLPAVLFVVAGLLDSEQPFWWSEAEELVRRGARAAALPAAANGDGAAGVRLLKRLPDAERLAALEQLRRSAKGAPLRTPQLRRAELPALEAAGIAIGNHTLTHPCLDRCPPEKLSEEISRAHEILTDTLGRPPRAFAYPNGNRDPRAEPVLRELGYRAAFLFDHRLSRDPARDPLRISRVRVSSTTGMDRFRIILSGLHPFVHHSLGRP